ncbi:hypothetical protein EZS27_011781 [termite gut metagenome]|uniref:Glycosyltransferase RgtA/B/C/D-like domain-containing protein n=1 Tax=termite gut metagenome TaxID=433724 RepID=A0A5J4S559_9ZZZZ
MLSDIIFIPLISVLGFLFNSNIKVSYKDKRNLNALWVFHLSLSVAYYFYITINGGDALGYWIHAQEMRGVYFVYNLFNTQGTEFMVTLNYIPANVLNMGFFSNTLLYGLLGFIGFTFFYRICIHTIPYNTQYKNYWLFPLLLFLPNMHFWSSGIGKDTMLFLCIMMVSYGMMRVVKRFPLVITGLLLSYGIRPHITLIMLLSFGITYVISGEKSKEQRIFLSVLLLAVAIAIMPMVLDYVNIDEASVDGLERFSEERAVGLSSGNSFVNISSYPYPLKVLTFVYRPFFFDINGIPALVASFENLLLLLLSIKVIRNHPIRTFKAAPLAIQGLFLFFILGVSVFSMSMSNLGIILRMRNMFLPGLIIFILWSFSYQQTLASKNKKNV